jgi:peptide/nickel transport system substrate-binding protein|tara:strand:- start:2479 stop:4008 length:1530 start_codon:yes stop_codon:yes gene_type:complete
MKFLIFLLFVFIPFSLFAEKTLVVATSSDPGHLNPGITTGYNVHVFADSIYSGLIMLNKNLQPEPDLAESWTISDDATTFTFIIRKNAKWHDGHSVTSEDVKYTFENILFKYHSRTKSGLGKKVEAILTPNPKKVIFQLKNSYSPMITRLNVTEAPILPKHIFSSGNPNDHSANLNPVGSGPFRFLEYKKGERVVLVKNNDFYLEGLPHFDRVVMQIIPDSITQMLALQRGEVDYIDRVPGAELKRLQNDTGVTLSKNTAGPGGGNCIVTVTFNLDRENTSKLAVRQAIAYAVDRNRMVKQVLFGLGRVAGAPINRGISWAHSKGSLAQYDFNPAKAESLLDEAGFKKGNNGTRLNLDIVHFSWFSKYIEVMKQDLASIGVNLISRPLDRSAAVSTIFGKRDFDLNLISYCNGADPDIGVKRMYVSNNIGNIPFSNGAAYRKTKIDTLFKEAGQTSNTSLRASKYKQIQKILAKDLPYWWLVEGQFLTAHTSKLSGFRTWSGNFAVKAH